MLLLMVSHRHKVVTHLELTLIKLYAQSMDGFGGAQSSANEHK